MHVGGPQFPQLRQFSVMRLAIFLRGIARPTRQRKNAEFIRLRFASFGRGITHTPIYQTTHLSTSFRS